MTTLLIVDDRPISREVLASLLDEYGYTVLEAEDGLQALELVKSKAINLIITDIAMPKMDGLAFVNELQADSFYTQIPIIIYTGMYKPADAYRLANASNIRFVLTKPCDPEIILGTIAGVLDSDSQFLNNKYLNSLETIDSVPSLTKVKNIEKTNKLQNINMRLTNVIEIGLDMSFENNIEKLIHILCKSSRQFLNANYAGAFLRDSIDTNHYMHYMVDETNSICVNRLGTENFSESIKHFFLSDKTILVHSPIIDMEKLGLNDINLPLSSFLAIPVKTQTVYGKVYFINKKNKKIFTPGDQRFMMTLADKFAIKYENLILYQSIEKMAEIVRSSSLDEMASSLAHEINQPLAAIAAFIKGCIKRLNNKNEVTPEILEVLNEISLQAERAGKIVHRVKNFVRKGKLFYETIDINLIIEQSILLIKQESKNNIIKITYVPNTNLPPVEVDKIQYPTSYFKFIT